MNDLMIFKNANFGEVRVAEVNGEPYFCAMDITNALGYTDGRKAVITYCKSDGVSKRNGTDRLGRSQQYTYINERNLYALIMHSKLESAERFQDWVYEEVLPSIRKHQAYLTPDKIDEIASNPDLLIKLATNLKEERVKRAELEQQSQAQQQLLIEQQPKVDFANAILASKSSILIGELAKIITQNGYTIGQNRLFKWLRDNGYLCKGGDNYNLPTQRFVEQGLFEVKVSTHSENEVLKQSSTTKVTPYGIEYFIRKFNKLKVA